MALPFVGAEEVSVRRNDDSVVLDVMNRRRHVMLPRFLGYYDLSRHELKDKRLKLYFVKKKEQ